jgi:hypothetical protein
VEALQAAKHASSNLGSRGCQAAFARARVGTSVAVRLPTAACAGAAHDAAAARNGKEIDHIFCMQQWFAA